MAPVGPARLAVLRLALRRHSRRPRYAIALCREASLQRKAKAPPEANAEDMPDKHQHGMHPLAQVWTGADRGSWQGARAVVRCIGV